MYYLIVYYITKMLVGKCMCPCGGGQSCIVDRRELNDWVHEDELFIKNKCYISVLYENPFFFSNFIVASNLS